MEFEIKKIKKKIKKRFPSLLQLIKFIPFLKPKSYYQSSKISILKSIVILSKVNQNELVFKFNIKPKISIIIAVYNNWAYTYNCLRSVYHQCKDQSFEIIVIDDCSSDETKSLLQLTKNVKIVTNKKNLGFLLSSNIGASLAKGDFLVFLNNDTQVQSEWLFQLENSFSNEDIGLVGSKLIYPSGKLQEAGGIIWKNGTGNNFGRLKNRDFPEYNYFRQTDYCSGASIMIKKSVFDNLKGFDTQFEPAYYEDTDLAMAVRKSGLKVMIQPKSEVIHFEGISSGTDVKKGVKKYQLVNKEKFITKWNNELNNNHLFPNDVNPYLASIRHQGKKTVLIIDWHIPKYDQSSGSNRLFQIVKSLKNLNFHVIFMPDDGEYVLPYSNMLQQLGVHVLYNNSEKTAQEHLQDLIPMIQICWLCNPFINEKYSYLKKHNNKLKLIYDTIDLHYVRLKRESQLNGKSDIEWKKMLEIEKRCTENAELVIAVSEEESITLQTITKKPIQTISNIHTYIGSKTSFNARENLLFIGGYHHKPNVDAAMWLIKEIIPIVWRSKPNICVTFLGSNPTDELLEMAKDARIKVTGYIENVTPYFEKSKIFISPLRYGAGMKGKIGQALEYGLPIISTNIGIEGMFLEDGKQTLVADTAEIFAQKILYLYENENTWENLSKNSKKSLEPFTPKQIEIKLDYIFNEILN